MSDTRSRGGLGAAEGAEGAGRAGRVDAGGEGRISLLLLSVLALLSAVAPFATDMYLPSFTAMAHDFRTSAADVQLTLTAFLIGLAAGQLVIGPVSDRLGRRRPLLLFSALAVAAAVLCALAPSVWFLIGFRFVQGFAGAAGVVIGRAVVADRARGRAAARAMSVLMSINGVAPVVAPLIGGALAGSVGWRGVMWVLTGISALMFLGSLLVVGESLPPERRHGGGLAATGRHLGTLVGNRAYVGYGLAFALTFGCLMAYISASPWVFQNVIGLSTGAYSVTFAVNSCVLILASVVNHRLVSRFEPGSVEVVAQGVVLVAAAALAVLVLSGAVTLWTVEGTLVVMLFGVGLVMSNASALAVGEARRIAGTASALMGAAQFGLGALVSPLVGLGGAATAVPMAVVVLVSAVLAAAGTALARRAHRR
ncbi:Bcr/CflA family efflux MFS transporter [Phaeacidiphilus oryzae]|uniref:Bcr/CflA family efflux MFS transporter n=1 Tax=Phaeacidiphilus oryzae TaxID=348818 RepID=UPI000AE1D62D|nr:Bcr/CflA family efflux MFS transporter [Phaeacidiphilus oryzae]